MLAKQVIAFLCIASSSATLICSPILVIYARGTDPSQTTLSNDTNPTDTNLASIASSAIPQASVTALSYPAAPSPHYLPSLSQGIDNLQNLIMDTVNNDCNTQIILLGYSQGASVVTGATAGGEGRSALSGEYLDAISGGVAIADPSFVAGLSPLDDLSQNDSRNGSIPDGTVQQTLNQLKGSVFRSLCQNNDFYCASGGNSGDPNKTIHLHEETYWANTTIAFLQSLDLNCED